LSEVKVHTFIKEKFEKVHTSSNIGCADGCGNRGNRDEVEEKEEEKEYFYWFFLLPSASLPPKTSL